MADRLGYYFIVLLVLSLILFSVVGFYGIYEYEKNSRTIKNWRTSSEYGNFIQKMNLLSVPATVLMLASLAICIPRRVLTLKPLIMITGIILAVFVIYLIIYPLKLALGVFFLSLLVIQGAVLILTLSGKHVLYKKDIWIKKTGSALLHFSLTLFLVDITIMDSRYHLAVFWVAGAGFMLGNIMSFYGR